MDLLADLTLAQQQAVTHFEGPFLVVAGPGSGKTRVITRRILYLLLEHRVRPTNILAVTFTNKAAGEMRQRVWQLLPDSTKVDPAGVALPPHRFLRVSTFHSFGAYFLRRYADRLDFDPRFTIYDQDDRHKIVKAALEAAEIDSGRFTPERIQAATASSGPASATTADRGWRRHDLPKTRADRIAATTAASPPGSGSGASVTGGQRGLRR